MEKRHKIWSHLWFLWTFSSKRKVREVSLSLNDELTIKYSKLIFFWILALTYLKPTLIQILEYISYAKSGRTFAFFTQTRPLAFSPHRARLIQPLNAREGPCQDLKVQNQQNLHLYNWWRASSRSASRSASSWRSRREWIWIWANLRCLDWRDPLQDKHIIQWENARRCSNYESRNSNQSSKSQREPSTAS